MTRHVQEAEAQVTELTKVLMTKDKDLTREVETNSEEKELMLRKMQSQDDKINQLTEKLYVASEETDAVRLRMQEAQARVQKLTQQLEAKEADQEAAVFSNAESEAKVRQLTKWLESKDREIEKANELAEEAQKNHHQKLKDESLNTLAQVSSALEAKLAKEQKRSQQLADDLASAKQCSERYQELSINLTKSQAD